MNWQDRQGVRTAEQLERKYDLGKNLEETKRAALESLNIAKKAEKTAKEAKDAVDSVVSQAGIVHKWEGTTLVVTSASGTSSADLKGDRGDSGVTAPVSGFFTMTVDEKGNLYVCTSGDEDAPDFEYDETTGNLYFVTEEG